MPPSAPSSSAQRQLVSQSTLSLPLAQVALQASLAHATSLGLSVNISIYSRSLHLLAFAAMDGAKLTSIDIAHSKAFTAAGHWLKTGAYGKRVLPGGPLFGVGNTNGGRFLTVQGGVPILISSSQGEGGAKECVGGIGVSGALPQEDEAIAQHGVDAVLLALSTPRAKL